MIKLNNFFSIKAGQDCVILQYKKIHINSFNKKTGKSIVTAWQTYHATLGQALAKFVDCELKASEDIKELSARINTLEKRLFNDFPQNRDDLKALFGSMCENGSEQPTEQKNTLFGVM